MKCVAIPVETKVRELDGKLWLALQLARAGFRVGIGRLGAINAGLDIIRPDIYIGKSASPRGGELSFLQRLKEAGVTIPVLDTEGAVFVSEQAYARERLDPHLAQHVDVFLAWGPRPASVIREHTDLPPGRVIATGNPRFDLLHERMRDFSRRDVERLRSRFGSFILVNTLFAAGNPHPSMPRTSLRSAQEEKTAYDKALLDHFVSAVRRLARAIRPKNMVLRPHPSEDHSSYRKNLAGIGNVFVLHQGSVVPWILGSCAIVHNSCTTAIEARLAGKLAVSYRPIQNKEFDAELPNLVSVQCQSYEELASVICAAMEADGAKAHLSDEQRCLLEDHFHALDGGAAQRIAEALQQLAVPPPSSLEHRFPPSARDIWKRRVGRLFGRPVPAWAGRVRHLRFQRTYREQKFPGLPLREVREKLQRLQRVAGSGEEIQTKRIPELPDCFWVEPTE